MGEGPLPERPAGPEGAEPTERGPGPAAFPGVVYLHGFASGPGSEKARFFRDRLAALGVEVATPDLDGGVEGFRDLTITRSLGRVREAVDRLDRGQGVVAIGSSLGGYTAALAAARDERVRALVLLAPGFDMPGRWHDWLGPEEIARWRSSGERVVEHHGLGRPAVVGFGLYLDAHAHAPYPTVFCPSLVLHGVRDETVPVEASRRWVERTPGARLIELDSDHGLLDVKERLWAETVAFLGPLLPTAARP